jgi:hypothetical protein
MNKKLRHLIAGILIMVIVFLVYSVFFNYQITPSEAFFFDLTNLIEDGSFENFNKTAGDCCRSDPNASRVYASKSLDSVIGNFSLNLTSENRCACSNFQIQNFSNENNYFIQFFYKGDKPRMCNWVNDDRRCIPEIRFEQTTDWKEYKAVISFTNNSINSFIHFYADSDGTRTVTNLYDDLRVHRLILIENPSTYNYLRDEEYIFKSKADNNIYDAKMISEVDSKTGEAYFIVSGKPYVTIRFPWNELVIIIIILLIVIRLVFKKEVLKTEREFKRDINRLISDYR